MEGNGGGPLGIGGGVVGAILILLSDGDFKCRDFFGLFGCSFGTEGGAPGIGGGVPGIGGGVLGIGGVEKFPRALRP